MTNNIASSLTNQVWSDRNVRNQLWRWSTLTDLVISVGRTEMSLSMDKIVVPSTALLYPACKNNKQTRWGFGRVCATGMYRSIGHLEFPKFPTGIQFCWMESAVWLWIWLPLSRWCCRNISHCQQLLYRTTFTRTIMLRLLTSDPCVQTFHSFIIYYCKRDPPTYFKCCVRFFPERWNSPPYCLPSTSYNNCATSS